MEDGVGYACGDISFSPGSPFGVNIWVRRWSNILIHWDPHRPPQPPTTLNKPQLLIPAFHDPPQPSTTLHNPPQPSTTCAIWQSHPMCRPAVAIYVLCCCLSPSAVQSLRRSTLLTPAPCCSPSASAIRQDCVNPHFRRLPQVEKGDLQREAVEAIFHLFLKKQLGVQGPNACSDEGGKFEATITNEAGAVLATGRHQERDAAEREAIMDFMRCQALEQKERRSDLLRKEKKLINKKVQDASETDNCTTYSLPFPPKLLGTSDVDNFLLINETSACTCEYT